MMSIDQRYAPLRAARKFYTLLHKLGFKNIPNWFWNDELEDFVEKYRPRYPGEQP